MNCHSPMRRIPKQQKVRPDTNRESYFRVPYVYYPAYLCYYYYYMLSPICRLFTIMYLKQTTFIVYTIMFHLFSSWNVMAHGDPWEGKWRRNWRMQWVASTLHTTSEHGVFSITTADAHTSAASSRLNGRPPTDLNWLGPFCSKDEIWFLRVCHHI